MILMYFVDFMIVDKFGIKFILIIRFVAC